MDLAAFSFSTKILLFLFVRIFFLHYKGLMKNSDMQHFMDVDVRCLFIHITGYVDLERAQQYSFEARQDPRYQTDFAVLTDLTHCDMGLNSVDVRTLANFMNDKWPTDGHLKAALIVDSDLMHGLARMYDVYSRNRADNPSLFHRDQADLYSAICHHFKLPIGYKLPDFLDISS